MNISRKFIVAIGVLFVLLFALQMHLPRPFSWEATFKPHDSNPFGCELFDSVMRVSLPQGYTVSKATLYQLAQSKRRQNVLIVSEHIQFDSLDCVFLKQLLHQGSRIIIAGFMEYEYDNASFPLQFGAYSNGYDMFTIKYLHQLMQDHSQQVYDTLYWTAGEGYPAASYCHFRLLSASPIDTDSTLWHTLLWHWETRSVYADSIYNEETGEYQYLKDSLIQEPVAACRRVGRGELVLTSLPLYFTNYAVLDNTLRQPLGRMMNILGNAPVVRTTAYQMTEEPSTDKEESSPLSVFAKHKPLRWAWRLAVALIVVFFIFHARRRQRVIPVIKAPQNHSLELIRLIGTMFWHRHDNSGLIKSKTRLFAEEVRHRMGLDIFDNNDNDNIFLTIAHYTGMPYEDVAQHIKRLRLIYFDEGNISEKEMMQMTDWMNEILKN